MKNITSIRSFFNHRASRRILSSSPFRDYIRAVPTQTPQKLSPCRICDSFKTTSILVKPTSDCTYFTAFRYLSTSFSEETTTEDSVKDLSDSNGEVVPIDSWEEEDDVDPEVGDGGDGGGVVLQNCPWGQKALAIAKEVILQFGEDMELYAFKTSPRGYMYVRIDKLSNEYGCPSMDEIESFSREYKKRLDQVGATGEIPDDLALEVSSPGADRLLRVPDDLLRFKVMPMIVNYTDDSNLRCSEKIGVYFLDSIETAEGCCVWKLADVKENRDPSAKGRPMSSKQKDWRLKLLYDNIKRVSLYVNYQ